MRAIRMIVAEELYLVENSCEYNNNMYLCNSFIFTLHINSSWNCFLKISSHTTRNHLLKESNSTSITTSAPLKSLLLKPRTAQPSFSSSQPLNAANKTLQSMKSQPPEQFQGTIHSHILHQPLLPKSKPLKLVKRRTTQPIQTLKTSKRAFEFSKPINSPQTQKPTNCTPEPLKPMTSIPPQWKPNISPPKPPKPITSPPQPPKPITSTPQPPKLITSPPQPPKPIISHPQPPKPIISHPQSQQSDSVKHRLSCNDKKYTHRASLFKHMPKNHPDLASSNAGSIKCMETMCSFTWRYLGELRRHLMVSHSIPMETENVTFSTIEGVFITMFMQVL